MASTGSNSSARAVEAAASRPDVVVALTARNDAASIGGVARTLQEGLARYCPSSTARFVLADSGSTDGTRDAARAALGGAALVEAQLGRTAPFGDVPYHGQPGRLAALRAVLQTMQRLEARACVVVDAGVRTASPEWIRHLVAPVLVDGFDYVSPYHTRRVDEGAITKGIVYPAFRALYGARLRQPAAMEFGCSARLAAYYLEQDFWESEQAPIGIDLWLTVAAVCGRFRVCEAALGPRGATLRDAPIDLSTTLAQIVGALFSDLEQRAEIWQRVRGSVAVPSVGTEPPRGPDESRLDLAALIDAYRLGYRELRDLWTNVLPPRTIVELGRLANAPHDRFALDDHLWATILYDFAFGYSLRVMAREHLLRSFAPLYSGWLASFSRQARGGGSEQADELIERLCLAFEAEKRYLISRWRWPERRW